MRRLAEHVQTLLERVEAEYGDADVGQVVLIAEVKGEGYSGVVLESSDPRALTVFGLCTIAAAGQFREMTTAPDLSARQPSRTPQVEESPNQREARRRRERRQREDC